MKYIWGLIKEFYELLGFNQFYWYSILIIYIFGYTFKFNDGNSIFIAVIVTYITLNAIVSSDEKEKKRKENKIRERELAIAEVETFLFGLSKEDCYQIKYEYIEGELKITQEFKDKEAAMIEEVKKAREKIIGRDWFNRLYKPI